MDAGARAKGPVWGRRLRTLGKLTWIETKLFAREPLTVLFALAFPVLVVVVLGAAFGNTVATPAEDPHQVFRGVGAMDYYVPGYVGLVIASIGLISLPVHIAAYRERGVLRQFRASAVSPWSVLVAQVVVGLLIAIVGSGLLVLVGFVGYGVRVPVSVEGVVLSFVLSALCFAAIGFLLGAVMPSARAAQGLGLLLFFVMMFLAGTDGPRKILGEALRRTGDFLPLTHVVTALQDPWIGRGNNLAELLLVTGMAVAAAALSRFVVRWE